MPSYSYHCSACDNSWEESRKIADRHNASSCPGCGVVADHKAVDAPGFKVPGGASPQTFSYRLGENMEKAKECRARHQDKFGKHDEYVQGKPGSRRVIDPEKDVTIHGDIGGSKKEQQDIIQRKAT